MLVTPTSPMVDAVHVDDAVLPAAAHLIGSQARHVLGAALDVVGGALERVRPCHVQYRPGRDLVVRFDSRVRWPGGDAIGETLLAATTSSGAPPGTLPVEAITHDGLTLSIGVWRWPFDPVLRGLGDAVTPSAAVAFLRKPRGTRMRLEVVSYRPTQRAVVRATDDDGTVVYVKAVRPGDVELLVERHRRLLAAGVPVPQVLEHDSARGLVAMATLSGLTVRERIKRGHRCLPAPSEYESLYRRVADVELPGARPVTNRVAGALYHAAMLAAVLPTQSTRLVALCEQLNDAAGRAAARSGPTVHGDLYDAQLITGHGRGRAARIAGVLDLDDAGPGDPLDDRATVIAHLIDRVVDDPRWRSHQLTGYVRDLRSAFGAQVDLTELDQVIAGTLVGLATGPFRVQRERWQHAVRRRLAVAEQLATNPGSGELRLGR